MTARDVDIDVDLDVDVDDLIAADALIDAFIAKVKQLDDDIRIDIDLLNAGVMAELRELERITKELDRERIHINISIDNISNEISHIHTQLQAIDNSKKVKIDVDISSVSLAISEVQALNTALQSIDRKIKIDIDLDINDVLNDITAIKTQLATIRRHDIDIDVDTTAAMVQIAALQAQLVALQAQTNINIGSVSGLSGGLSGGLGGLVKMGLLVVGLILFLPPLISMLQLLVGVFATLGVAIGVVTGGLVALVAAIGVAMVGIAGPMMLGISSITALYEKNAKLTSLQKLLKTYTDGVINSFNKLKDTVQPITYGAIVKGSKTLMGLLETLTPIAERAGEAVSRLISNFRTSLGSDNMVNFFDYIENAIKPLTLNVGNGLGLFFQGIFNWMVALAPLTSWVAQGFENMMGRFANWTASLQGSENMTAFIEYVKANMPVVGDIFSGMRDGIVNWFAAFDFTAADGLAWMAQQMKEFSTWASNLDTNDKFQAMLERLKNDGPIIAGILADMAIKTGELMTAISNIGRDGETGIGGMLGYLSKLNNGETFLQKFIPSGRVGQWALDKFIGVDKKEVEVEVAVKANTSQVQQQIQTSVGTNIELPVSPKFDITPPQMSPIKAQVEATEVKVSAVTPKVPVVAQVSNVETLSGGPLKVSTENAVKKAAEFSWPPMPKFDWPKMPTFTWPNMPLFRWPAYPRFSWPPMPSVSVNVKGAGLSGFSSGLGRVSAPEMPALVHQNEAILQDHNAQFLRDIGALEGDGRNPVINKEALSAYGKPQHTTTNVTQSKQGGSVTVEVGGISVVVQGGNTNEQTGNAVKQKIEEVFASLGDIIPIVLEG